MSNDLMRFSVAMPEDLLVKFDHLVARRGLAKNRSEVVRDLVREALVEDECSVPGRIGPIGKQSNAMSIHLPTKRLRRSGKGEKKAPGLLFPHW